MWRSQTQVICSMDSVKPMDKRRRWSQGQIAEYNRERFEDLIAAGWDLVIVDEAHRLGGSTDQVARFKLGQGLAEAAPYFLMLSATPHQGKKDAFHRLVSLIDSQAFPDVGSVTRDRVQPSGSCGVVCRYGCFPNPRPGKRISEKRFGIQTDPEKDRMCCNLKGKS